MNGPGSLQALASPQQILARYEQGEAMPAIAQELGVSHQAIYKMLLAKCPEEWKEYQSAKALAALDIADQDLGEAQNMVEVTKANHRLKSAQWKLERVLRRIYGQDAPQLQVNINLGDVGEKISRLEQELRLVNETALEAKLHPRTDSDIADAELVSQLSAIQDTQVVDQ